MGTACLLTRPAHAALPVPAGDMLAFRMVRQGSEIGRHTVAFARQGDVTTVRITVDAVVKFLSIPIVRYTHRAVETWQGARLAGLAAETDKNGDREWAKAELGDQGLVVTGSKTARYVAPVGAIPTSYWDKKMLDGRMISLEDGVLLAPKVAELRTDTIRLASGREIAANHYNLSGAFDVDLWYDATNTWAGMAMTVKDGSEVRYERL